MTYITIKISEADFDDAAKIIKIFQEVFNQLAGVDRSIVVYPFPQPVYTAPLHCSIVPFILRRRVVQIFVTSARLTVILNVICGFVLDLKQLFVV